MNRGRIIDHVEPADREAMVAGFIAGIMLGVFPSLIAIVLEWLK